ncbi:MAG: SpoIID/LytB domain-containing protein [Planctomycetes bacterium]|nr:SpoIID/LytB domain-containing protein [Planctomycetota bacterium]
MKRLLVAALGLAIGAALFALVERPAAESRPKAGTATPLLEVPTPGRLGRRGAFRPSPAVRPPAVGAPALGTDPLFTAGGVHSPRDAAGDASIIRVNVIGDAVESLEVAVDGPWRIESPDRQQVLAEGRRLPLSTVTATAGGLNIGDRAFATSSVEIVPLAVSPAAAATGAEKRPAVVRVGSHEYRGRLRLHVRPGGKILAVNFVPLSEYLASVVDSEMPLGFPTAARKAQAIIARTYAVYQMHQAPREAAFDVFASSRSQRYLGWRYRDSNGRLLAGESSDSRRCVAETSGILAVWQGQPFAAYYSAVCGGRTCDGRRFFADAAGPTAASVECDWCREADLYRWRRTLPAKEVRDRINSTGGAESARLGPLRTVFTRSDGGPRVVFGDGRRERTLETHAVRELFTGALPSPHYTATLEDGDVVFSGRGHGHGVGFCQWGSRGLALAGADEREIVRYYYPGATLAVRKRTASR